jgi:hypothetical protein
MFAPLVGREAESMTISTRSSLRVPAIEQLKALARPVPRRVPRASPPRRCWPFRHWWAAWRPEPYGECTTHRARICLRCGHIQVKWLG